LLSDQQLPLLTCVLQTVCVVSWFLDKRAKGDDPMGDAYELLRRIETANRIQSLALSKARG